MNAQSRPVATILLFVFGCIVGGAVHAVWSHKSATTPEREPESAISSAEWSALKASVARVEAQLASAQLSAPGERIEVGRSPTPSVDALAQTVRELQTSIDQLRLVADKTSRAIPDVETPHELDQTLRETNWPAIDALRELEFGEEGAALRAIRFSTPNEILRRFGPPEHAFSNENGTVNWDYTRTLETPAGKRRPFTYFTFAQGGVVGVVVQK